MENGVLNVVQKDEPARWFNFNFHNDDVVRIYAPQTVELMDLQNDNGSINVTGVNATLFTATNENGSINLKNLAAEQIMMQNHNGSLRANNIKTAGLKASNQNGSIKVHGDLSGMTEIVNHNGSITLTVKDNKQYYDLSTHNGSVKFIEQKYGNSLQKGDAASTNKIVARNINGSVKVDLWVD
jgi:DUF4097 and DUF4098 domain-containing protein YvlB